MTRYYGAVHAFQYYQAKYDFTDRHYVAGEIQRGNERQYVDELEKLRGHNGVWILFSHIKSVGVDEEKFFIYHLDEMEKQLDVFRSVGAVAYLYDLSRLSKMPIHARLE